MIESDLTLFSLLFCFTDQFLVKWSLFHFQTPAPGWTFSIVIWIFINLYSSSRTGSVSGSLIPFLRQHNSIHSAHKLEWLNWMRLSRLKTIIVFDGCCSGRDARAAEVVGGWGETDGWDNLIIEKGRERCRRAMRLSPCISQHLSWSVSTRKSRVKKLVSPGKMYLITEDELRSINWASRSGRTKSQARYSMSIGDLWTPPSRSCARSADTIFVHCGHAIAWMRAPHHHRIFARALSLIQVLSIVRDQLDSGMWEERRGETAGLAKWIFFVKS